MPGISFPTSTPKWLRAAHPDFFQILGTEQLREAGPSVKKAPTGCLGTTTTHSETVPETQLCPWEEASSCGTQTQSLYRLAFLGLFLLMFFCLYVFFKMK